MTRDEFQELAAARAVGALEPAEESACEAFLAALPAQDECHLIWQRAREAAALLPEALEPIAPPPKAGDRITAQIGAEAGDAGTGSPTPAARTRRGGLREAAGWVVAALAAVALLFVHS